MKHEDRSHLIVEMAHAAGGMAALARKLGIKRQAIYQWSRVPAERVLEIERLTGLSRYILRSDIYGPAPKTEAAE